MVALNKTNNLMHGTGGKFISLLLSISNHPLRYINTEL